MVKETTPSPSSVVGETLPPALPAKQRSRRERHPSHYDNVPPSSSPTRPPPLPLKKKHSELYSTRNQL